MKVNVRIFKLVIYKIIIIKITKIETINPTNYTKGKTCAKWIPK
jgi:hypothetical protein